MMAPDWRAFEPRFDPMAAQGYPPADETERVIDALVQRRLATDPAYRNAENAEAQAEREAEIVREVERQVGA